MKREGLLIIDKVFVYIDGVVRDALKGTKVLKAMQGLTEFKTLQTSFANSSQRKFY